MLVQTYFTPPLSLWKQLVNSLTLYKDTNANKGFPQKHDKVWFKWLADPSIATEALYNHQISMIPLVG